MCKICEAVGIRVEVDGSVTDVPKSGQGVVEAFAESPGVKVLHHAAQRAPHAKTPVKTQKARLRRKVQQAPEK
jgi:hypothetical protein